MKIIKYVSLGILAVSLVFASVNLFQSVRFKKSGSSYDYDYSWVDTVSKTTSKTSSSTSSFSHKTSSKTNSSSDDVEIYSFGHAKVGIPKQYASQLTVEKVSAKYQTYDVMLRVYEKAAKTQSEKDLDESLGLLFEIGYVNVINYNTFLKEGYYEAEVFAKSSTKYYVYTEPTDVQFYRTDGGSSSQRKTFEELQKLGDKVKTYFWENNDVEKVSSHQNDSSSGHSYSTPSYDTHHYVSSIPSGNNTSSITPAKKDCGVCKGSGHCTHCNFGDCPSCYGKGRKDCLTCLGTKDCGSCGGSGYTYRGTGLNFKKVDCSRCRTTGDCSACGGKGYSDCYSCDNGNCNFCDGTFDCNYCNGSGEAW